MMAGNERAGVPSTTRLLMALAFAAEKHRHQLRKDAAASPYINHPIAVATALAIEGGVTDEATLLAACLHDTVEDTKTTFEELEEIFGTDVSNLVRSLTDDKSLEKGVRKQLQVEHAAKSSDKVKQIKISDKLLQHSRHNQLSSSALVVTTPYRVSGLVARGRQRMQRLELGFGTGVR